MAAEIYEIIDEGFQDSVTEQLITHFSDTGESAIYFRSTNQVEVMLASTEPITREVYEAWLKEKKAEEEDDEE